MMDYYQKKSEDVLDQFNTSENGLTSSDVKQLLDEKGYNEISVAYRI